MIAPARNKLQGFARLENTGVPELARTAVETEDPKQYHEQLKKALRGQGDRYMGTDPAVYEDGASGTHEEK
jgi:hypothetical protein